MNRRRFLKLAARSVLAGGVATAGYAWRIEPHWIEVLERGLPVEGLPQELIGRRLVQISDLHVGPIVDDGYLIEAFHRIGELEADLLVVTGDLMTYAGPPTLRQTARVLTHLPRARLGTFAILGNHDYGTGHRERKIGDELAARMRGQGIEVLRNERRDVAGLTIAGIDDLWGPYFDIQQARQALAGPGPAIALCHNPDTCDEPIWKGFRGWVLAGHTHGGQCRLPLCDPPILPVQNKRYTAGHFGLAGGRQLYINRGLGYLKRVRFAARPEVTVFQLERSEGAV